LQWEKENAKRQAGIAGSTNHQIDSRGSERMAHALQNVQGKMMDQTQIDAYLDFLRRR
jgi:hypothetical protein